MVGVSQSKTSGKVELNWGPGRALKLKLALAIALCMGAVNRRYKVAPVLSATVVCISYAAAILGLKVISITRLRECIKAVEA
jgi:hypothetical protein